MKRSFYQKLSAGEPVRILVNGDSISEPVGPTAWTELLCSALRERFGSEVSFDNVSMGGNASYAGYARAMYQKDEKYDLMINGYGQNDSPKGFSEAYETIIRAAARLWPDCSQISILESAQKGYSEKIQVIRSLAAHYGIPTADTVAPFLPIYDSLTADGCHPNDEGKKIYAKVLFDLIAQLAETGAGLPDYSEEAVNPGAAAFDSFRLIPAGEFAREGDVFEAGIGVSGALGIDYYFHTGPNSLSITLDGREIAGHAFDWTYNFSQRHIMPLGAEVSAGKIRLEFGNKQQADGFRGIIVTGG